MVSVMVIEVVYLFFAIRALQLVADNLALLRTIDGSKSHLIELFKSLLLDIRLVVFMQNDRPLLSLDLLLVLSL